ncbi:MAG: methyltransferase [Candidatus Magasanikbacteria bacterium CG10_big_fil_rev_8_21_14_0_10_36_32]|uniref:Methyltransferase n=1 Tax=Candidatus Magasanikbacteria bacterium CG10_big_fil_rev_8_21_14_0_10_36_32 TaxID=1974646 RepID=A0A2M6W622_9BACT|nr:MAG: methyltransferase [Candidatus Magasanikbacteria bacterium CG10_big_fil_rev_8_21_14_0_10_36_32]
MTVDKCRVCGQKLFEQPLLRYGNMPMAAQCLPDEQSLKNDRGINLEIYQCSGCGLVQLNSESVPYYKEVIRATIFSSEMKEFRMKQFTNFVEKYSLQNKKIIEIGSGRGENLFIMSQCGVNVFGIEYSADSVEQCVKNGLNVSKGFVENSNYVISDAPFDAFFSLSFIEHLPELNQVLQGIRNNLTDDAVGIVEVPNFDMILRSKLFSEFTRDHLFYFTKETFISTLEMNGFETVECGEVWHDYIISAVVKPIKNFQTKPTVVKKIEKVDLSSFYNHQSKLRNETEKYISQFQKGKVAVWGAGHQALAVISMLGLGDKIKYVVDSAVFKQDKYTPATHIPIVAPDMLHLDPMEAVIVIAGSYSEEVSKIIRVKYNQNINVVILRDFGLEKV